MLYTPDELHAPIWREILLRELFEPSVATQARITASGTDHIGETDDREMLRLLAIGAAIECAERALGAARAAGGIGCNTDEQRIAHARRIGAAIANDD